MDLATCTLADFSPFLGQTFTAEEGVGLVLGAAHPGRPRAGARTGFSLHFVGPRLPALPQRLHALNHPALGELLLFLVPISEDSTGRTYEAVFT
ncbi:MAG: hypothetical protein Q8N23_03395 [Archangium sp.]|nr:hypothetical protein [Archangium sp.]MDP3151689.1 hypothetical protein [Archangium sp.]MDP3573207.1 hypothetical protein [Archangium sp.]